MPRPLGETTILELGEVQEPGTGSGSGATLYPEFTTSGTGPFTVGIQVTDLSTGLAVTGRYWVNVSIGTTAYNNDATGGITYNVESCHRETGDGQTSIMTNASGYCEIEISASANRHVAAAVGEEKVYTTGELTYGAAIPAARATRLTGMGVPGAYF